MIRWGIDLGGTKIEGVVIDDSEDNRILSRRRVPTEAEEGYEHMLNQIAVLINQLKTDTGLYPEKIGMGTPGSIDPGSGLLKNANSTALNGEPLLRDLVNFLEIPIKMANDANCFALAETHMGIVKDVMPKAQVVFGIIMGTGVGGGLVVNGQVINGANGITGEWGHNFLHESGGKCYCGKTGCVETIISGPSLERYHASIAGEHWKLKDIVEKRKSNNAAHATIDRLIEYFGLGVSTIINMIDPDVIVIGGGVGNIDLLYTEGLFSIEKYVFNPDCHTRILRPKLGDSAGVFGAAFL